MADAVRRSLPNALTVLRLVLAAAFFAALNSYRYPGHHTLWGNMAVGIFILAAITDALDGWLARRWKVESVFGRIMDPFCDKVLVLGAFIYLAGPRFAVAQTDSDADVVTMATGIYPWMVVVILARELLVTGLRGQAESMGVSFASTWSGKWKMILQSIAIPVVLFAVVNLDTVQRPWAMWVCTAVVYLTVAVTAWSGLPYLLRARKIFAGGRGEDEGGAR